MLLSAYWRRRCPSTTLCTTSPVSFDPWSSPLRRLRWSAAGGARPEVSGRRTVSKGVPSTTLSYHPRCPHPRNNRNHPSCPTTGCFTDKTTSISRRLRINNVASHWAYSSAVRMAADRSYRLCLVSDAIAAIVVNCVAGRPADNAVANMQCSSSFVSLLLSVGIVFFCCASDSAYSYTFLCSVACLSVCLSSVTLVHPAWTVRRISMQFGRYTCGVQWHIVLCGVPDLQGKGELGVVPTPTPRTHSYFPWRQTKLCLQTTTQRHLLNTPSPFRLCITHIVQLRLVNSQ